MSLQDIANKLDVTKQTVHKWEKKQRPIPEKRLDQLSEILRVPKEYFLKEELTEEDKRFIKKEKLKAEMQEIEDFLGGEIKVVDNKLYYFINEETWNLEKAEVTLNGEWEEITIFETLQHLILIKKRIINGIVISNWNQYKTTLYQALGELILLEEYREKYFKKELDKLKDQEKQEDDELFDF